MFRQDVSWENAFGAFAEASRREGRSSDPIAFLTERIDAVERERDALLERSQLLEQLVRSFVDIIAAQDERALAAQAMRAAVIGLGFTRSIWFRIESTRAISALFELDGPSVVESEYGGTLPEGSTLYRITTGDSDIVTGWAADDDAPLFDTRRRFAAASVCASTGDAYLFYADGSNDRAGSSWNLNSMRELGLAGLVRARTDAALGRTRTPRNARSAHRSL